MYCFQDTTSFQARQRADRGEGQGTPSETLTCVAIAYVDNTNLDLQILIHLQNWSKVPLRISNA